ncbi:MAG: restriction endonuclease subunit S [Vicinamibacterales bacterium]
MSAAIKRRNAQTRTGDSHAVLSGYKRTEVGIIPEDWESSDIGSSKPFITSGSRGWARYYAESGNPFLRIGNLTREKIYLDVSDVKFVQLSDSGDAERERTCVQDGDLLVSITADIGIVAYVDGSVDKPAYINQHLALIRLDPTWVSPKFIAYYLASERPQRLFVASMDVGAKAGLNLSSIRKVRLALPPAPEQRAIAEALSDVDGLLGALETLIAKKRAIKQGAMQQLLTGKTRLPGFRGPWETRRLGEHVTYLRTGTNSRAELTSEGPTKYLHYGDIHTSTQVRLSPSDRVMPSLPEERARTLDRLKDGDLVFVDASEDLDGVGKSVEITGASDAEIVAGLHTIAARFDKAALVDGFKAFLQFCPAFRQHLRRLAAGTKVYATNRGHISSAEVPLPAVEEQTAIAAVLSDMDAEIAALEARRDKTRAIKQGMMQQLLTGRVRLVKPEVAA